jgi:hypothetical protein
VIHNSVGLQASRGLAAHDRAHRVIYRLAFAAACFGTVVGQLHALARFATPDGQKDLELPMTRAWAVPAARLLHPLLDWADPYTVYVTYGRTWIPVFAMGVLCGLVVYRRRRPRGVERAAWWGTLSGLALVTLTVAGDYFTPWMDQFFAIGVGGMAALLTSATVLGVMAIKNGLRPRVSAWLLLLSWPFLFLITSITSLGNAFLPLLWAIVLAAHQSLDMRSVSDVASVEDRASGPANALRGAGSGRTGRPGAARALAD